MAPPTHPFLQRLSLLDRSSFDFSNQLDRILHEKAYEECAKSLGGDDLVWFVDYLDQALEILNPSDSAARKCIRELRSVGSAHMILPTSYTIASNRLTVDPLPFASGGFGDMHNGTLDGLAVCVKRLRVSGRDAMPAATKMFCQEAVMWKHLQHRNILPLLGATISPPQLISTLMSSGDLSEYIEKSPDADRLRLLAEIAAGLSYLHSRNVIHGDLKCVNILVDMINGVPHARIADFGIAIVTKNLDSIRPATRQNIHTPLWSAPEVLRGENPGKESDVYSFAMITVELLSEQVPFSDRSGYMAVLAILGGERPPRPKNPTCSDDLWALIQRCWDQDIRLRPEIHEVQRIISSIRG